MGFLSDWHQRRAAKAYAARLGPWLARSFGASAAYTPAQIRRGIEVLHLDANYEALGYAAFLARREYDQLVSRLPIRLTFGQARALLLRHGPSAPLRPLADDLAHAHDLPRVYREVEGHAYEGDQ